MRKLIFIIMLLTLNLSAFPKEIHDYAIIQGKNVICREKPTVNSKKIKVFLEGELVFDPIQSKNKTKIGNDEYYWYKVQTQDKKEGWVFGKYILVYDKNNELHREYQKILNAGLGGPTISKVKIEKDDKYDYIVLRYIWNGYLEGSSRLILYKNDANGYKRVINDGLEDDNYYINDKYIYLWNPKVSVRVYNRNILDNNKYYELIGSLNVFRVHHVKYKFDSFIEFNPKTEVSTINWRYEKGKPIKIEKYKFNGIKFEQIE